MNRIFRTFKVFILVAAVLTVTLSGCDDYDGTIIDGARDIIIDVDNSMFNEPDAANPWEQGPGIDELKISIVLESGESTVSLKAEDAESGRFSRVTKNVTGVLERIDVSAVNKAGSRIVGTIDSKSPDIEIEGWQTFANINRFNISYMGNSADNWKSGYLIIDISPMGGNSVRFKVDSGAVSIPQTDWTGAPLVSRQLAIQPVLNESTSGLKYDLYICIVDENLRELYKPSYADPDADYEKYPWVDLWSYAEITKDGRMIHDKTYKMAKYNEGDPISFVEPAPGAYDAQLIDLTAEDENPVGKYLMFAIILKWDVLSVPSKVGIVEIR